MRPSSSVVNDPDGAVEAWRDGAGGVKRLTGNNIGTSSDSANALRASV